MSERNPRLAIAALAISASAFVGLVVSEGYSEKAYPDPTYGERVPTVGFGTTGADVTMQTRMSPVQAVQRAHKDIQRFEAGVKACVTAPLTQAEYDLYVDLAYNTGLGKAGVKGGFCVTKEGKPSGIVTALNAGYYATACKRILDWRYSNGQDCSAPGNRTCRGLWQRRLDSYSRCMAAAGGAQ